MQVPSCGLTMDICAVAGGLPVSILRRLQLGCWSRSGSGCTTANKNNEISHSILTTRIRFMVTSFCFSIADSTLLSPSIQCSMMLFSTLKSDKFIAWFVMLTENILQAFCVEICDSGSAQLSCSARVGRQTLFVYMAYECVIRRR